MKKFTPDMLIFDALGLHERAADVLKSFGLPCTDCAVAEVETIEEGARSKGIDPDKVLEKLNALLKELETPKPAQSREDKK
jgi:hybrid cluster-associated redox disulfide protein